MARIRAAAGRAGRSGAAVPPRRRRDVRGCGNIGGRLYRGEVSFDFVGRQKLWYTISGLILVISIVALLSSG